ncbi:MAG: DUF3857 domain-containing protein [Cytophagales bacterium]|nr:DUF3857 domain-containing protein [Cytophagales bacterium]
MMTKRIVLLSAACISFFISYCQLEKPRAVNMLDFQAQDSSEDVSAVYLVNDGHTEVRYDRSINTWVASTERIYRVKILKTDALGLGNVKIRLYQSGKMADQRETVEIRGSSTYNFNVNSGRIEKSALSKKNIYKTELDENAREVSFSLPNVQVGSVIEVAYVKHSPFIHRLDDWHFQKDFPVKRSRFAVTIPAFYVYVFQKQGYFDAKASKMELDREMKTFGRYTYQDLKAFWLMEDLPAFRKEPFMTTREDYISKLVFQLQTLRTPEYEKNFLKTWQDVTTDLQNSHRFKLFYTGKKDFKEAFTLSTAEDPLERAQAIYSDFKKTFVWNKYYGVYPDVGYKKMMEGRTGNASSMGLTLFQVLRQAGLDAQPVLFSPRFNGVISYNYPFSDKLIATVVRLKIDGKTYLLDPLQNMPFGYLSSNFLNGRGLVLGNQVEWQDLTKAAKDQKTSQVNLTIAGDSILADMILAMEDYGMVSANDELEDLFKPDWELQDLKMAEDELTSRKVTASIAKEVEDGLILIPLTFDELIFDENPIKAEERSYPVDFFYRKRYSYQLNIELSDEYTFESLPESKLIRLPNRLLDVSFNVTQRGNTANITFLFWTRTNSFDVRYYPKLREAYALIEELDNTVILVKKKT